MCFYGGLLVDVKDQKEHNCLMRYGISQGYNAWFHTDGKTKNTYLNLQLSHFEMRLIL